jgi:hypothetical protein
MLTAASVVGAAALTPNAQLGKAIFFDTNPNSDCARMTGLWLLSGQFAE